jgi:hypothetical protein
LQKLLFLTNTCHVDDLVGVTKNKQISAAPSDWSLELARIVMLSCLVTGVLVSTFGWSQSGICGSESRSRTACFPRFPGGCRLCSNTNFRGLRGQANVLANALIEMGILCFSSTTSRA